MNNDSPMDRALIKIARLEYDLAAVTQRADYTEKMNRDLVEAGNRRRERQARQAEVVATTWFPTLCDCCQRWHWLAKDRVPR